MEALMAGKKRLPIGQELERYCREHWQETWTVEAMTEALFGRSTTTLKKTVKTNFAHVRARLEENELVLIVPNEDIVEGKTVRSINSWKVAGQLDNPAEIIAEFTKRKNRVNGFRKSAERASIAIRGGQLPGFDTVAQLET
jgi:hypothetical protein